MFKNLISFIFKDLFSHYIYMPKKDEWSKNDEKKYIWSFNYVNKNI